MIGIHWNLIVSRHRDVHVPCMSSVANELVNAIGIRGSPIVPFRNRHSCDSFAGLGIFHQAIHIATAVNGSPI